MRKLNRDMLYMHGDNISVSSSLRHYMESSGKSVFYTIDRYGFNIDYYPFNTLDDLNEFIISLDTEEERNYAYKNAAVFIDFNNGLFPYVTKVRTGKQTVKYSFKIESSYGWDSDENLPIFIKINEIASGIFNRKFQGTHIYTNNYNDMMLFLDTLELGGIFDDIKRLIRFEPILILSQKSIKAIEKDLGKQLF